MHRLATVLLLVASLPTLTRAEGPLAFHLRFDAAQHKTAFTGRAYVMLFKNDATTLASGPAWFNPQPFFAVDVKNVKPGDPIVIGKSALAFPKSLDQLPRGTYTVQAVIDLAPGNRSFARAPGNLYAIERLPLDPATTGVVPLKLNQVVQPTPFKEQERRKLVEVESKLLTAFHKRPTKLQAGVALPESFGKDPKRGYAVIYEVPGFGGGYTMASPTRTNIDGIDVLHVVLDANCHHGHHVFADSANNGPVGQALIEELIPAIENRYRGIGVPAARFITGHSSGGWSSLWLQVAYPEFFGGCWSTAPDPVDFRDFQRINLYNKGENMFTDAKGERRPIARRGEQPVLWYRDFSNMEVVMGHGGQLASFEAVFSERGKDGEPRRLWDRKTGAIDLEVARSWEKYDIRLVLERNWLKLAPRLKGKLHVYMGDLDTFYLEGATMLLKQSLEKLKSDAKVELFKGKDHGSLMSSDLRKRIAKEMANKLRAAKLGE